MGYEELIEDLNRKIYLAELAVTRARKDFYEASKYLRQAEDAAKKLHDTRICLVSQAVASDYVRGTKQE